MEETSRSVSRPSSRGGGAAGAKAAGRVPPKGRRERRAPVQDADVDADAVGPDGPTEGDSGSRAACGRLCWALAWASQVSWAPWSTGQAPASRALVLALVLALALALGLALALALASGIASSRDGGEAGFRWRKMRSTKSRCMSMSSGAAWSWFNFFWVMPLGPYVEDKIGWGGEENVGKALATCEERSVRWSIQKKKKRGGQGMICKWLRVFSTAHLLLQLQNDLPTL